MVASQDDARHLADGYPAGGLKGLGCLVDEECPELHPLQQTVGTAHQRTGHDTCLAKQLGVDAYLYLGSTALQTVHLLMEAAVATMAFLPHLANGLPDGPQLRIVGMRLEAPLVGERQHLVVDACGIADAQDVHPTVHQLFRYPVYRHVALRTNQHLWLAPQCLIDGFHESRCLARSRRSVYDGDILCPQHLVDGFLLRGIEVREAHGFEGELTGLLRLGIEQVAQLCQSVVLGIDGALQGIGHRAVARRVEGELYAKALGVLQFDDARVVGNGYHHAVAVDIAHRRGVFKKMYIASC